MILLATLLLSTCAPCHRAQTQAFAAAGMTLALQPASTAPILQTKRTTTLGPYSYTINGPNYTVTNGPETLTIPLQWAFGRGATGQTYLYEKDGRWYESRVSYFGALKGLDITLGQQSITLKNIQEAAGRPVGPAEAAACFDCHATGVVKSPKLDLAQMAAGILCERCHGPAEAHVKQQKPMRKLATQTTEQQSDFCGQCHRTWEQIAANGPRGIQNIRFQPYRLANSKCYDAADPRIRCTACHPPHAALNTNPASYDAKCQACHTRPCRVGTSNCVTCHMPQLDLPGAHKKFADHRIRIVRPGDKYPD